MLYRKFRFSVVDDLALDGAYFVPWPFFLVHAQPMDGLLFLR